MIEQKFTRKGRVIGTKKDDGGYNHKHYPSNNAAKRESAILQRQNGGLGRGSLVLVK